MSRTIDSGAVSKRLPDSAQKPPKTGRSPGGSEGQRWTRRKRLSRDKLLILLGLPGAIALLAFSTFPCSAT